MDVCREEEANNVASLNTGSFSSPASEASACVDDPVCKLFGGIETEDKAADNEEPEEGSNELPVVLDD